MRDEIPLMFQAQIDGRSQIQRLIPGAPRQQAYDWADEWIEGASAKIVKFSPNVQTQESKITWRFVSNSGQDEGVIRPVIGAKGLPFYPGASMKGAFLRICTKAQAIRYCGGEVEDKNTKPGILRFHGGYPKDKDWAKSSLVDIVHPQENWQLKDSGNHAAFIQISLYQPTIIFGISSTEKLDQDEWDIIWSIWKQALERGIGSRVSAGYGQIKSHETNKLFSVGLRGQGLASQLIDKTGEFRPNMFKAALRGHTLRLFSGVTDEQTAEDLTKELWGGFAGKDGSVAGLLGIAFNAVELDLDNYQYDRNIMPTYELINGTLQIICMRDLKDSQKKNLKSLVTSIVKFSMLLGGFGKSWRRVDHRLCFPQYLNYNPMIGCHWEFTEQSKSLAIPVNDINELSDITAFLIDIRKKLTEWLKLKKKTASSTVNNYRETWHPKNVEVWGRIAEDMEDTEAVRWFHGNYSEGNSIKGSILTGKMGQIGRIWHRMYPRYITKDAKNKLTQEYVELLTIFPDDTEKTDTFLDYLANSSEFIKLYPLES